MSHPIDVSFFWMINVLQYTVFLHLNSAQSASQQPLIHPRIHTPMVQLLPCKAQPGLLGTILGSVSFFFLHKSIGSFSTQKYFLVTNKDVLFFKIISYCICLSVFISKLIFWLYNKIIFDYKILILRSIFRVEINIAFFYWWQILMAAAQKNFPGEQNTKCGPLLPKSKLQ